MKIGTVIVTYNPNILQFRLTIESLEKQVDEIIIVDNGSDSIEEISTIINGKDNYFLLKFFDNQGIASAINVGIDYFSKKQFDYVLTSDQDSLFSSDYMSKFRYILSEINDCNEIAAFVPVVYDAISNTYQSCFIKSKIFIKRIVPSNKYSEIFQAITSGMIINLKSYELIGSMNEKLFIDWVDYEWCWRSYYFKYKIIACKDLCIYHNLGDKKVNIGFRNVNLRSHIRHYYITRNAFYLALYSKYITVDMKFFLVLKSFGYLIGYSILSSKHLLNFIYCLRGLIDGICKRMGKIS
jgi:rhamnosyltransferase